MPVPKNKDACFSFMKKEHPHGIGDVENVNKQRQAICLKGKKKKKANEGLTFKEYINFLNEMTYGDKSEPHYEAVRAATFKARELMQNIIVVRRINPETGEKEYIPVLPEKRIPAGFEMWAEVTPRGKVRRLRM